MSSKLRVVITGASSGIGRAAAIELAQGNKLFLTSRRLPELKGVAGEVEERGGVAHVGAGDVTLPKNVRRLSEASLDMLGGVDVLFANAGVGYFGPLEEMTLEEYNSQFETNVRGVFLWIKHLLPHMKAQKSGQIVVTSSNLGMETSARASIYSATKHVVQAMVWCLREELKGTGVKAATINPGSVSTSWYDGKDIDRSKMLTAEDIARVVRYIVEQKRNQRHRPRIDKAKHFGIASLLQRFLLGFHNM
ncbi:MAG: SDR family oxidoreductase [Candidatus Bathyarchaeia archaeon]